MAIHSDKYTKLSPHPHKRNKTKQSFRNNIILHLNIKKTVTYDVGLRQTPICAEVKPVNGISDHIIEPAPFNKDFREPFTCLFLPFKM
jgi:hypothetical protein